MAESNVVSQVESPTSTESSKQSPTKRPILEGTNTLPVPSPRMFILKYDALSFELHGDEETLITVSGRSVDARNEPMGALGIFRSETRAKTVGREWLYNQMDGELWRPVPYEWDELETPPGSWIRSGNEHSGWVDGDYTLTDLGRTTSSGFNVALTVRIEAHDVDGGEDDEEMGEEEESGDEEEMGEEEDYFGDEEESGDEEMSDEEEDNEGD